MADTTTRITNMPDSGSPANVALQLLNSLGLDFVSDQKARIKERLDVYAECLLATQGQRNIS